MDFEKGDRIVVISDCHSKGKHGVINEIYKYPWYGKTVASVKLDNGVSRTYNTLSIKLENKGETNKSKESEENNMLDNKYNKVVFVKFVDRYEDNKIRCFAYYGQDIIEGDYVLCDNATGYTLAKVEEVITKEEAKEKNHIPTKEVICKCDMTDFRLRNEARAKATKLKAEMDKRVKEIQKNQIYEMLAEKDPELKILLEEYNEILR